MADADRCVCCGAIIPEGLAVCQNCEREDRDTYERLSSIAVLAVKYHTKELQLETLLAYLKKCPVCSICKHFENKEYCENHCCDYEAAFGSRLGLSHGFEWRGY